VKYNIERKKIFYIVILVKVGGQIERRRIFSMQNRKLRCYKERKRLTK
jgi:hypothetical protein